MRMKRLWVLLVLMVVEAPWVHAEESWRLDKDEDGIQVYTRAVEGEKIREIRAVTRIPATLSAVVAVLDDVAAAPLLSDVVSEATIVQRQSVTRSQVYHVLEMPWPLDDRDLVNQREIHQDAVTLAVTISSVAIPEAVPPRDGRVRIFKSRQQWVLTPTPDGEVDAEMLALTDPNGPIPAPAINAMSVGSPFSTLQNLRALAQSDKYRQVSLPFVREPGS